MCRSVIAGITGYRHNVQAPPPILSSPCYALLTFSALNCVGNGWCFLDWTRLYPLSYDVTLHYDVFTAPPSLFVAAAATRMHCKFGVSLCPVTYRFATISLQQYQMANPRRQVAEQTSRGGKKERRLFGSLPGLCPKPKARERGRKGRHL